MSDTLNDLKVRDIANLQDIIKRKSKVFSHKDRQVVQAVLAEAMRQVLLRFGFNILKHAQDMLVSENHYANKAQEELARLHLKIEHRAYDAIEDKWRTGLYIYRNDEIVFFSQVVIDEPRLKLFSFTPKYHGRFWSVIPIELR